MKLNFASLYKLEPQIWALQKLHFWNFYRPLPCDLFSRGVSAVQPPYEQLRGGGINAFVTYILKYICFSSKFNFREFHLFCQPISYSNFKLCCLVKGKCYGTQRPEKGHTAMYVNVVVWLHTDCIFTHWLHFYTLTAFLHTDCIFTHWLHFYSISQSY